MQCFVTRLYNDRRHQLLDSWIRLIYVRYFKVSFKRRKPNFRIWLKARLGNSTANFLWKLAKFKFRQCLTLAPATNTSELSDVCLSLCLSLLYLNSHLGANYTETGETWPSSDSCWVMCIVHPWNTLEESEEKCPPCEWKLILHSRLEFPCFARNGTLPQPQPGVVSAAKPLCLHHPQRKMGSRELINCLGGCFVFCEVLKLLPGGFWKKGFFHSNVICSLQKPRGGLGQGMEASAQALEGPVDPGLLETPPEILPNAGPAAPYEEMQSVKSAETNLFSQNTQQ